MNFYPDSLTPTQLHALRNFAPFAAEHHFYLAGGTALAIFLHHRQSLDLDWFTQDRISDPMEFAQTLRDTGIPFDTNQTAPGSLNGLMLGVRVCFLEFRYPLLSPLVHWPDTGANLASLDDLACMKLSAIAQRGAKKDFFDMYALCSRHRPLEQILELYQKKFSVTDISPVLYGLVFFDDADEERDPLMLQKIQWSQVKQAFRNWVKVIR